jgi:outer membrane protein TolC
VTSDTFRRFLGALLALAVAAPAAAQDRPASRLAADSPFRGGVPSGAVTPQPIALSIGDAIRRALDHNLGVLQAEERIDRAQGVRWNALSRLLPQVNAAVSETRRKFNLEAFGFPLRGDFPKIVGPFNVFDARVFVSQSLVNTSALRQNRAEAHNLSAARLDYRSARDFVVLVSASLYLETLAGAARVETARAQFDTAQALHRQALDLRQSGIIAGLEVVRAEVRLSADRQRVTAAENGFQKAKLQLARVTGLPVGQEFTLSSSLPTGAAADISLDQALDRAYRQRPDFRAAEERVSAAEDARQAVSAARLPSLNVNADYGAIGLTVGSSLATFSVTGTVNVPIFEGGAIRARIVEAEAELRRRHTELEDLRAEIYYDVRSAFLDLQATGEELETATRGRELANQQLVQSRDRFAAGVASNIEVVQAQEAVTLANEQYISALYGYNVSKAMLAQSIGEAESAVEQYLGGTR